MDPISRWLLWGSVILGILFLVIVAQPVYLLTNSFFRAFSGPATYNGAPTVFGQLIHAMLFSLVIFFVLTYTYRSFVPSAPSSMVASKSRAPVE